MVREVDRAIGAISTLILCVSVVMIRELLRKTDPTKRWEKEGEEKRMEDADAYHKSKYGAMKMPLFQHRGSCDCEWLRFFVLAPKRVEAFDDSNTLPCKKGRYPYVIVPTSCFEMVSSWTEASVYQPQNMETQHVFCGRCGVHVFHFDPTQPDYVAVNVYCLEESNFDDIKIVFVPKGSRPVFSVPRHFPSNLFQRPPLSRAEARGQVDSRPPNSTSKSEYQKQLLMWSNLEKGSCGGQLQDDTQSTESSSSSFPGRRFSFDMDDRQSMLAMKEQLEFYLKRHLEEPNPATECVDV